MHPFTAFAAEQERCEHNTNRISSRSAIAVISYWIGMLMSLSCMARKTIIRQLGSSTGIADILWSLFSAIYLCIQGSALKCESRMSDVVLMWLHR